MPRKRPSPANLDNTTNEVDMSKNTVVYLTRSSEGQIRQLIKSIKLFSRNFLPWSPADIWVFHEKDFDRFLVEAEPSLSNLCIHFAEVDFSTVHPGMEEVSNGQRGYRHMCHFFANDIFLRRELQQYDYQMRLDVDSYILSPVKFNVFEKMQREGIKYTYRMIMNEKPEWAIGLLETAEAYFAKHPEVIKGVQRLSKVKLYYTNFEICDLAWFRNKPWQDFFAAIDKAGGIWRYRWGDAPIRWFGVKHMLKDNEIFCLRCMKYYHQFKLEKYLTHRTPWEYLRYAMDYILWAVKARLRQGKQGR